MPTMPTKQVKVTIDFETRSTIDLKKCGAWVYSLHDSTDVMCVCYMVDDGEVEATRGYAFGHNKRVMERLRSLASDDRVLFEAHNASFEFAIWQNIMVQRHGMPEIVPERWRCSASVASYKAMPRSLGDLAKALNAPHKKDEEGKRTMMKMCKPVNQKFRHLHGEWYESEEDWETLISYCIDDVKTEHACSEILGELPPQQLETWLLDFRVNQRGFKVDVPFIEAAKKAKDRIKSEVNAACREAIGVNATQVQKLKGWFKQEGMEIPVVKKKDGTTAETMGAQVLKAWAADEFNAAHVHRVIKMRQDVGVASLAKLDAALHHADPQGIVRGVLVYHAASTGRWAGKALQPHNLPRGVFSEETVATDIVECCDAIQNGDIAYLENWFGDRGTAMQVLKSCLRGMIVARDDHVLRVMDYSQIEARVLPWLAGQQDVLQAFIDGKDLYKFTAAQIYKTLYEQVSKSERFIGKTASLALGYQGGANAFSTMALNFGVAVDRKQAEKIKRDWREKNDRIVKFWYDLEKAAVRTIGLGSATRVHKKISFRMEGHYLTMVLPSGRKLWYYQPKVKERVIDLGDGNKFTKAGISFMGSDSARNIRWGRVHTYGGKLAENATQATSCDLLTHGMHMLEGAGYPVVLHVHDEIVSEVRPDHGSLEEMKGLVLNLPSWAEGLPVDADGFETTRYYKG